MYEDILLEVARTVRECEALVDRRLRSRQLGLAWVDLGPHEGQTALTSRAYSGDDRHPPAPSGLLAH
jgi:hypothetical protein